MRRGLLAVPFGMFITCAASAAPESPADRAHVMGRLQKILEFEQTGIEIPWRNPDTGASGVIVVERTYFLNPKVPCRDFTYTVEVGLYKKRKFKGTGCREVENGWRLDDGTNLSTMARALPPQALAPAILDPLAAVGIDDSVLENPPVELRLDDAALSAFAPAARRSDGARLERLAVGGAPGAEDLPTLPSGPPPGEPGTAVAALLGPVLEPDPPLACATTKAEGPAMTVTEMDLVVVLDTTTSMRRELGDIRADVMSAVRLLQRMVPRLNVGFVAYRDRGDNDYLTRAFQLAPMTADNLERLRIFVERLEAGGGGDVPEALDAALGVAEGMAWRPTALGQILVIGDAPPPSKAVRSTLAAAKRFSHGGDEIQRRLSAVFSGKRRRHSRFYERLAANGGGCFTAEPAALIESVLRPVLVERPS